MYTRRQFVKATVVTTAGLAARGHAGTGSQRARRIKVYRDKAMGCFMGAAIADAMGGPVECQHYRRIAAEFGDFDGFLPYRKPPGLINIGPGYALDDEPGNITDDSYIRADLARYVLANEPPYTAKSFAEWLLANAEFSNWWKVAVSVLRRIEKGEVGPEESGLSHRQGGGGGWWHGAPLGRRLLAE